MMNNKQFAIIKKDMKGIVFDKRQFPVLLIIPGVFTIFMPTLFIFLIHMESGNMSEFQHLMDLLPVEAQSGNEELLLIEAVLNYIMPVFFMMIPIMAAMVMAASSFVGEKENRTLETLLYSPLSLRQIFHAKILAAFAVSMLVSFGSFLVMLLVAEAEMLLAVGSPYIPSINWLIYLLLVAPAVSMIAITLIVRSSAKAQTAQEAQQRAVFMILPIILLTSGQLSGVLLIGPLVLFCLGIVFVCVAAFLLKGAVRKFNYETLLK